MTYYLFWQNVLLNKPLRILLHCCCLIGLIFNWLFFPFETFARINSPNCVMSYGIFISFKKWSSWPVSPLVTRANGTLKWYYLCSWILSMCFFSSHTVFFISEKAKEKSLTLPHRNFLCLTNKSFQSYVCQKIYFIFCLFILLFFHCSENNMFWIEPSEQMVVMCPSHQGMKKPECNPFLSPTKKKNPKPEMSRIHSNVLVPTGKQELYLWVRILWLNDRAAIYNC